MPSPVERERPGLLDDALVHRVALALALLPLVIAGVDLVLGVGDDFHPSTDWALTELKVRDVGRHEVTIGLYSRNGWSHPGPALFYLLAVPYRLTGSASIGLGFGALLINGAAITGMAAVARRRGGTGLVLCTLVGCGVVVQALGVGIVRDPWVCWVTVLPFGLLVFLVWSMAAGERWALPVGAGLASFLVQTHIGYAALGLPLFGLGAVWLVARHRRRWRELRGVAALTALVLGVLWLPVAVDALFHEPSNLGRLVQWFRDTDEPLHTVADGLRVVGGQFGLPPEWVSGARPANPLSGETRLLLSSPPPVLLVPFVLAVVWLWRRRHTDALRLAAVVAAGLVVGVAAVARTNGTLFDYRLRWTWILAMVAAVLVAWAAWMAVGRRWPGIGARVLVPLTLLGLVGLAAVNGAEAVGAGPPQSTRLPDIGRLTAEVVDALPAGEGDVVVRFSSVGGTFAAQGLVLSLERRGVPARVESDPPRWFGAHRVHQSGPVRAVLRVAGDEAYDQLAAGPARDRLVAFEAEGDGSPAERALALERQDVRVEELFEALEAGTISDEEYLAQVAGGSPGPAVGVFLEPAGSATGGG